MNNTVIEPSPAIRQGGYMIDFFGAGVEVAEKMNLLGAIDSRDIRIPNWHLSIVMGKEKED